MVVGMTERPPIPLVELVRHYHEFKTKRYTDGRLVSGPYRSQKERVVLAQQYVDDPHRLVERFVRSVTAFGAYANPDESLIGGRTKLSALDTSSIDTVEVVVNGPTAAAYVKRKNDIHIEGLGDYTYVDREVVPARTTSGPLATMANRFDDEVGTRSTSAMKADLLLRSHPAGRPTIGEVKVSTAKGDDADPVYALIQALALAAQLVNASQRARLSRCYPGFAEEGPLDVLILLFLITEKEGRKTYRADLVRLAAELCARLDQEELLRPHIERVALVGVKPDGDQLRFALWGG
jgi:hypothetical protein